MMEFPIPYPVIEIVNGALAVLLSIMYIFALVHIFILWRGKSNAHGDRYTQWQIMRTIYWDNKPSIAWAVIAGSLASRFWLMFYVTDAMNHKLTDDFIVDNALFLYMWVNSALMIGVVCWIRNISPFHIPNWVWFIIFIASLAFSTTANVLSLDPISPF